MNDFILTELENQFITRKDQYGIRRQSLYPSESSVLIEIDGRKICRGKCMRASYYRALDTPETNPTGHKTMMKANLGKWIENGLIDRWKSMGIWEANNIKFFDIKNFVSGELDAILKTPDGKRKIGYEVKTYYGHFAKGQIEGMKGRRLKDGGYSDKQPRVNGAPKIDQFLQAVYYSHKYVTELKLLDEYRLYYLERGEGCRCEFRVGTEEKEDGQHICWWQQIPGDDWNAFSEEKIYQPFTIEDVHRRCNELIINLREKKLPAREFLESYSEEDAEWAYRNKEISSSKYEDFKKGERISDWQCDYCSYKDLCKKDGDTT
jgi:hypothetical protein